MKTAGTWTQFEVYEHAVVGVMVAEIVEDAEAFVKNGTVVGMGGVNVECHARCGNLRISLDSNLCNNCESRRATAFQSPKQIRVFRGICGNVLSSSSDSLERQNT